MDGDGLVNLVEGARVDTFFQSDLYELVGNELIKLSLEIIGERAEN